MRVPIYDYHCDHCGHDFSSQQGFDDERLAECPRCGKRPRRLVSRPAIVFKGSGWHVTDYRAKSAESSSDGAGNDGASKSAPKKDAPKKEDASAKPDQSGSAATS